MSMSRATRMPVLALGALLGLVAIGMALGSTGRAEAASVPAAPTNLRRCQLPAPAPCLVMAGSISVYWNDNAIDETRYELQWVRAAPPLVWQTVQLQSNATTALQLGLTPGQRYYYRVRACNATGCSAFSNTIAAWA